VHGPGLVTPHPLAHRPVLPDCPRKAPVLDRCTFLAGTGAALRAAPLAADAQQTQRCRELAI